jgi:hypothetical protein
VEITKHCHVFKQLLKGGAKLILWLAGCGGVCQLALRRFAEVRYGGLYGQTHL